MELKEHIEVLKEFQNSDKASLQVTLIASSESSRLMIGDENVPPLDNKEGTGYTKHFVRTLLVNAVKARF